MFHISTQKAQTLPLWKTGNTATICPSRGARLQNVFFLTLCSHGRLLHGNAASPPSCPHYIRHKGIKVNPNHQKLFCQFPLFLKDPVALKFVFKGRRILCSNVFFSPPKKRSPVTKAFGLFVAIKGPLCYNLYYTYFKIYINIEIDLPL